MNRIEWSEAKRSYTTSQVGKVGKLTLFEVTWDGVSRDNPNKYRLSTRLPLSLKNVRFPDEDAAKRCAERVMRDFMGFLGAEWKENADDRG